MNPKITAIILFVVGAGIALYIFNSGGATRLASVFKTPNVSSTTASAGLATSSTTNGTNPATTTTTTTTSSGLINFFKQFFALVFRAPATSTYTPPTLSSGIGATYTNYQTNAGSNNNGGYYVVGTTTSIPAYEIPTGYTVAQLSPYFHIVRLGSVSTYEITLSTSNYNQTTSTVDITGWEIKTNRGGEYIPQAVNIYSPIGLNPANDIVLFTNQYNTVNLYSNSSPANLRTNECMGYLTATNQFNPALPNTCPAIDYSVIKTFSGQCQNYIESLGYCGTVNMSDTRIPLYDYSCQEYLKNNFTYNSCVANHDHDTNFLGNTWEVWMGSTALDPYHDNVVLLDKSGLVVDSYSY